MVKKKRVDKNKIQASCPICRNVIEGDKLHPFAWGKSHLKQSTIIGLILAIIVPIFFLIIN